MSVVVSCATAAALIAEGAVCFNTDTGVATCDGEVITLQSVLGVHPGPILVCGSDIAVESAAEVLEADGLPAWRVTDSNGIDCCRCGTGPASDAAL